MVSFSGDGRTYELRGKHFYIPLDGDIEKLKLIRKAHRSGGNQSSSLVLSDKGSPGLSESKLRSNIRINAKNVVQTRQRFSDEGTEGDNLKAYEGVQSSRTTESPSAVCGESPSSNMTSCSSALELGSGNVHSIEQFPWFHSEKPSLTNNLSAIRKDCVQRSGNLLSPKGESFEECSEQMRPGIACKLPNELVERILAMIPFPNLLKVRILSKAWYERFVPGKFSSRSFPRLLPSPVMDCNVGRNSLNLFQKVVSSVSWRWSVYCPVIMGDDGLIGYDPVQKVWRGLCSNLRHVLGESWEPWLTSSRGPLICGVSQSMNCQYDLVVTNVLTRNWRKLPSHPNKRAPSLLNLVFDSTDSYKVFLVTEDPYEGPFNDCQRSFSNRSTHRCVCSQSFDSTLGTWKISQSYIPAATSFAWRSCSVYFSGLLYCLSGDDRDPISHPVQLWLHDPEQGSWLEIDHPFENLVNDFSGSSVIFDLTRFQLVVCGSKILVVMALDPKEFNEDRIAANSLYVFELDPETLLITWKSRGPPATLLGNSEHISSDGVNIYFCTLDLDICSPIVVYTVSTGKWSCLSPDFKTASPLANKRWAGFAFQPGVNPFISP